MAIIGSSNQYKYTGRGPLDPKATVKTYADLLSEATWTITNTSGNKVVIAFNGMITAVWLDKDADKNLTDKNGVYFLFDPDVGSALAAPDVTNADNWHKLADIADLTSLVNQISEIESELTGVKTRLDALEADKVIIRRDNEYNFKSITPAKDEICLADVPGKGLRVKIGDGETKFSDLPYIDEQILTIDNLIVKGYFNQGEFYGDSAHSIKLDAKIGRIYIDTVTSKLYIYNGLSYEASITKLPNATAQVAGAVKLYDETGYNIDGTMTQRAITSELNDINDELDDKIEMAVSKDDELLIFAADLI